MTISSLYGTGSTYADWSFASSRRNRGGPDASGSPLATGGGDGAPVQDASTPKDSSRSDNAVSLTRLTPQEAQEVAALKASDSKVRAHEQAHMAAAGGLATSGASYAYERGPDGQRYAVSGEVSISMSKGNTPQETISNASRIQAAALAPADPSAQDRRVAAAAAQMKAQAEAQLRAEKLAEQKQSASGGSEAYAGASGDTGASQAVGGFVNTYA